MSQAIAKPQLRGLLHSQLKKQLVYCIVGGSFVGFIYNFFYYQPKKRAYLEYYRNYDIDKEFEIMRKKGLFNSCSAD